MLPNSSIAWLSLAQEIPLWHLKLFKQIAFVSFFLAARSSASASASDMNTMNTMSSAAIEARLMKADSQDEVNGFLAASIIATIATVS